jgi:hypothetical protein
LAFPEMDKRQAIIDNAAENTCEWIFENSSYQAWVRRQTMDVTHGLLWIKGKPVLASPQ